VRTAPRPPLSKRLRPGHWTAIDYVVGGLLGIIIFGSLRKSGVSLQSVPGGGVIRVEEGGGLGLLPLFVAVGVAIAVARRRHRPGLMLGLLLAGSIIVTVLSGGASAALLFFLPVAYVLYYIVATFEDWREAGRTLAAVAGVLLVDAVIMGVIGGFLAGGRLIPAALCVIIAWSVGYIVRQRRRYSIGLQVEAASKAVAEERLRIARELHDVVAHSMSVIAVQAGYGQYVIDSQPADARAALGAIQSTSREALDEMRRMLGALRQADETSAGKADPTAGSEAAVNLADSHTADDRTADDGTQPADSVGPLAALFRQIASMPVGSSAVSAASSAAAAPLFPAPGLADLDRLVARTGGAGVQVAVVRRGTVRELPASIDLSAYRIIQEALTNVVKHAHASRCDVLIAYGRDELIIEVTDSGAGAPALTGAVAMYGGALADVYGSGFSSGHGIIGMRERVSLLGGSFSAGPMPGYGFRVNAHIPLPANGVT
jgi:signal transduction histidine kinase